MMRKNTVPDYALYGEFTDSGVTGFLHVERILVRAAIHSWNISAHHHGTFSQVFFITAGGGIVLLEGQPITFRAPALLWIPARTVHGFAFDPNTDGTVVTVSSEFLAASLHAMPGRDFSAALTKVVLAAPPREEIGIDLAACFHGLEREAGLGGFGARQAAASHLTLTLLAVVRSAAPEMQTGIAGRASGLFYGFRDLVEARFRDHWRISQYASALGVGVDRLHEAVQRLSGQPPKQILQDRMMLEAKRALVFTTMNITEIAYDLGFDDPAYFSRYFNQRAGMAPLAYRKQPDQTAGKSRDASP